MAESAKQKKKRSEEWFSNLSQVRSFAHAQNRWPSTISKDEKERSLAQWWARQKGYANTYKKKGKAPGMNDERADAAKTLVKVFIHFEREGSWIYQYNRVKRRIRTHKKLWDYNTKVVENKKTIVWWNQQKTFARKFNDGEVVCGMTVKRARMVGRMLKRMGLGLEINKDPNLSNKFKQISGFND